MECFFIQITEAFGKNSFSPENNSIFGCFFVLNRPKQCLYFSLLDLMVPNLENQVNFAKKIFDIAIIIIMVINIVNIEIEINVVIIIVVLKSIVTQ